MRLFFRSKMIFITMQKWRKKPTKEIVAQASKIFEQGVKEGVKILGLYWTLGRYDVVAIFEGKDEKSVLRGLLRWGDLMSSETLVAVTREEAMKLVE